METRKYQNPHAPRQEPREAVRAHGEAPYARYERPPVGEAHGPSRGEPFEPIRAATDFACSFRSRHMHDDDRVHKPKEIAAMFVNSRNFLLMAGQNNGHITRQEKRTLNQQDREVRHDIKE